MERDRWSVPADPGALRRCSRSVLGVFTPAQSPNADGMGCFKNGLLQHCKARVPKGPDPGSVPGAGGGAAHSPLLVSLGLVLCCSRSWGWILLLWASAKAIAIGGIGPVLHLAGNGTGMAPAEPDFLFGVTNFP